MIKKIAAIFSLSFTAACVQPPQSPMEKQARLAVAAEYAAQNCGGYAGGYDGAKSMKEDANRSVVTAKNLGATPAVFAKAKSDVEGAFNTTVIFADKQEACNDLVSQIAWNSN